MLSAFDRALLDELQNDFPFSDRPYAVIAERLDTDEQIVLDRLKELKATGYVRKMGAFFDSEALGYTGTLIALKADPENIDEIADTVNSEPGVTHNYQREGKYNLWFTLQSKNERSKAEFINKVRSLTGVAELIELPAERKYKIRVRLPLKKVSQ